MKLGTDHNAREDILKSKFDTIKNISEVKTYRHRILTGGFKINRVFYPTIRQDKESGEMKSSWNTILVSKEENLFTKLIVLDEKLKAQMLDSSMTKGKVRSRIRPSVSFLYLIFDRDEPELQVDLVEYKWKVVQEITRLENEIDPDAPSKLLNGPAFCWDAIINHTKDETTGGLEWMKHKYAVTVYKNVFVGTVPKEVWNKKRYDTPWDVFIKEGFEKEIFNEEELKLINECAIDLEESSKPLSDDEIREELINFPIFPGALDSSNNTPIFANPKAIWEEVKRLELPASSQEDIKMLDEGAGAYEATDNSVDDFGSSKKVEFKEDTETKKESGKRGRPSFTDEV